MAIDTTAARLMVPRPVENNVEVIRSKIINLGSSVTSRTPEIMSMQQQEESGRPIILYELGQNMFDYGRGNPSRPPRFLLGFGNGTTEQFNGKLALAGKGEIATLQMRTWGEGDHWLMP